MNKITVLLLGYLVPALAFAEEEEEVAAAEVTADAKLQNPLKEDSFEGLFQDVLTDIIIPVSAVIGVVFIILAGLNFVMAQGNESKVTAAKKTLLNVLIGVAIIISAEIILDLLLNTVKQISNVSPS